MADKKLVMILDAVADMPEFVRLWLVDRFPASMIVKQRWCVHILEPGWTEPYQVGSEYNNKAAAEWYLEKVCLPKVGKRTGYKKGTRFYVVRRDRVETVI